MNVLVIAAHPDDEALGCGGTMARHAARGDPVDVLFVADGESARQDATRGCRQVRREQALAAARILGAAAPRFLDLPDNRLDGMPLLDLIRAMEGVLAGLRPEIVYTHHVGDLNVDHGVVTRAVMTLYRPLPGTSVRAIRGFEVLSSTHWSRPEDSFRPMFFVDIGDTLDRKLAALACYAGELRDFPHARSIDAVEAMARFRGAVCGLRAAEAFTLLRHVERD